MPTLPDSALKLKLFGAFQLTRERQKVSFPTRKIEPLLACLALRRGVPQSRQQLAFLLFPDSTDAQARTNLRNIIHHLRVSFPEIDLLVEADPHSLTWKPDAPITVDVIELEQLVAQAAKVHESFAHSTKLKMLERAAELVQGDLLPDCYDDWIAPERERLRDVLIQVLNSLLDVYEKEETDEKGIACAQRLRALDPLSEAAYLALMRIYAHRGDRGSALRWYHSCVTTFRQELDTEPGAAIREAYQELLATAVSSPVLPMQAPLLGRDAEWQHLRAVWKRAARGQPSLLIITGEAGIGKTRLAEEGLNAARREGADVAVASCYASESEFAYAPVLAWLRAPDLAHNRSRLGPLWLNELVRLLPEIRDEYGELQEPLPLHEAWQRHRLFEALAHAALAGSKPVFLLINDLQWCDRDSLEWINLLLRFDVSARLLLVATARSEEFLENAPLLNLLDDLRHADRLVEIALGTLSRKDAQTLAEHLANESLSQTQAERLFAETEGNPLFIVETVRAGKTIDSGNLDLESGDLETTLPPKVRALITRRLSLVSPDARQVLNTAAVIGRSFTFDVLLRAAEADQENLVRGLDELWQRRIVREASAFPSEGYDFTHDKLRAVAYDSMSTGRRRILHQRVAHTLESLYSVNLDAPSGQIAFHLERGGMLPEAVHAYQRAANFARQIYANADALKFYRRALELVSQGAETLSTRQKIASALGDVLFLIGRYQEAQDSYQGVLDVASQSDAIVRSELWRKIGNCSRELHRYEIALNAYDSAEQALEPSELDALRWQSWCEIQIERFNVYYWLPDALATTETVARLEFVIEQYGTASQRARLNQIRFVGTMRQVRYRGVEQAIGFARNFIAALQETNDPIWIPSAHFQLGFALLWQGELDQAEQEMLTALDQATMRGDVSLEARSLTYLAIAQRWRNRPAGVRAYAERAFDVATRGHMFDYIGAANGNLAWLAWRKKDYADAHIKATAAIDAWAKLPNTYMFQWVALFPLMAVEIKANKLDQALSCATRLLDEAQYRLPSDLETPLQAAVGAAERADLDTARARLMRLIRLARQSNFL